MNVQRRDGGKRKDWRKTERARYLYMDTAFEVGFMKKCEHLSVVQLNVIVMNA